MNTPPDIQRGDPITAAWLNAAKDASLKAITTDGKITLTRTGGNVVLGLGVRIPGVYKPILAKITGSGAEAGAYQAAEVIWDESESVYIDKPNGRTWDGGESPNLPELREVNGAGGIAADTIIQVLRTVGDEGAVEWVFVAAGGASVAWAKVVSVDGNEVTATPCDPQGNVADPAPSNVVLWLFTPDDTPVVVPTADDVLAYLPGVVVDGDPGVGGVVINFNPLPPGEGQYKVLQLDDNDEMHWDYVRAHE